MFTVEMLPAQRGDCLWITYGQGTDLHHVVVDAGPRETIPTLVPELERRIAALPGRTNRIELLVVTHIDADHIQGVVSLLSEPARLRLFRDVWFNGWKHLNPLLGAQDGERLGRILDTDPGRWNAAFGGAAVELPPEGPRTVTLAGGMQITVLGPTPAALARQAKRWLRDITRAGLTPGQGAAVPRSWRRDGVLGFDIDLQAGRPYKPDTEPANGASITFVARYRDRSVLCTADAPAEALLTGLDALGPGRHRFTAVKVPHHGSAKNTSTELVQRITARKWLVSTNGATHHHPNPQALARIVVGQRRPEFVLNYSTPDTSDLEGAAGDRYAVRLPPLRPDGTRAEGIRVNLG